MGEEEKSGKRVAKEGNKEKRMDGQGQRVEGGKGSGKERRKEGIGETSWYEKEMRAI